MRRTFVPFGGPGWVHDLFWLLIVIAVIAGVVLVLRMLLRHQRDAPPPGPPRPPVPMHALYELDLRYARGEVDRAEYLQRRSDLLGEPPRPPEHPRSL